MTEFISELIRAASDSSVLTHMETALLLQRAAARPPESVRNDRAKSKYAMTKAEPNRVRVSSVVWTMTVLFLLYAVLANSPRR